MAGKILGTFVIFIGLLYIAWTYSFEYAAVADSDNQTSVVNSSRNAMTEAVNLGSARVNEELTINEEIAVESVLREYSSASDFYDGSRYLNVYQVSSDPPMIAVESYLSIGTPIKPMLNRHTKKTDVSETIGRSREIIIYEAKETVRP